VLTVLSIQLQHEWHEGVEQAIKTFIALIKIVSFYFTQHTFLLIISTQNNMLSVP
jgi:hypothetical protein